MAVNVKIGVDTSAFKSSIQEATAQLKTFDAQLKYAEATMKATGNAEQGLTTKMNALTGKLETQKRMAQQMAQQLERMRQAGVDPLSKEYQKLATSLLNVSTGIVETESQLNDLTISETKAADGADKLTQSVNGISKKVSLDQVISGIGSITSGLENAAKKAVDFGKQIFDTIMDTAAYADDVGTLATNLGLSTDEVQKMMLVAYQFEAPVETIAKSWKKMRMSLTSDSEDVINALYELKVDAFDLVADGMGQTLGKARDWKDVWWEVGEALLKVNDESKRERLAQTLLGRSWDELSTLFTAGREKYEAAMDGMSVASEEAVENAASLNDRIKQLEGQWETLKLEVIGAIAPALEKGAEALGTMLDNLTKYLQTEEGQQMLERLGTAVSNLFSDLSNISTEDVVNNVTGVLNGLTDGLEWLYDHWEDVKNALTWIVKGWAALEITGGVLDIVKVVTGLGDLVGIKAAGTAAGTSWASAFASAAMKAAPFLAFLYTMLKPGETGNNDLVDAEGNLTEEGKWFVKQNEAKQEALDSRTPRQVWFDEMNDKYNGTAGSWALWYNEFGANPYYSAIQNYWDKYRTGSAGAEDWSDIQELFRADENGTLWDNFKKVAQFMYGMDKATEDLPDEAFGFAEDFDEWLKEYEKGIPLEVDPEVPENAAEMISNAIGTVMVRLQFGAGGGLLNTALGSVQGFANGLPWVNNDGLYLLHRGERVLTASENKNYTYNSNTYFGSVNLNNGLEIDALTESIARQNRRQRSGYGT